MATQMQLEVLFRKQSHGRLLERKNNNKVLSFSTLFLMFTLTWITEKELERVIENKRDEFSRKKNMKIQSGCGTLGPFIRGKISRVLHKRRTVPFIRACLI